MDRQSQPQQRLLFALAFLAAALIFLLLHGYNGLVHDARLYTLQALNALHPELFGTDVFVALGSQDNFTLFSPLYAATIEWLGIERAAATITLASNLLFLAACFGLARSLLTRWQSWTAILLLLLIPAQYGPSEIFRYLEGFVTPRQPAAALVMFGLVAWAHERPLTALAIAIAAMFIHPIIGFAGVVLVIGLTWVLPHRRALAAIAALGVLAMVVALAGMLPLERLQFDETWYEIASSRQYLDLRTWNSEDWGRIATLYSTLIIGALTLQQKLNRLALGAIMMCTAMLLLAFVGGNLLRIAIISQAQTWRALWLVTVLAVMLLPPLFVGGWRENSMRSGLVLLAAAWAAPHASFSLALSALAVLLVVFGSNREVAKHARLLLAGSSLILLLAIAFSIADARLVLRADLSQSTQLNPLLDHVVTMSLPGVLPALLALFCGWLAMRFRSTRSLSMLVFATAVGTALLFPPLARAWIRVDEYSASHEAFSVWRSRIPPGADVFWTGEESEAESGAFYTWILLERPSYISRIQASNALFSRRSALEMRRRSDSLRGLLPLEDPFRAVTPELKRPLLLEPVCRRTRLRYIVSRERLADAVGLNAPASVDASLRDFKLYICP